MFTYKVAITARLAYLTHLFLHKTPKNKTNCANFLLFCPPPPLTRAKGVPWDYQQPLAFMTPEPRSLTSPGTTVTR